MSPLSAMLLTLGLLASTSARADLGPNCPVKDAVKAWTSNFDTYHENLFNCGKKQNAAECRNNVENQHERNMDEYTKKFGKLNSNKDCREALEKELDKQLG